MLYSRYLLKTRRPNSYEIYMMVESQIDILSTLVIFFFSPPNLKL